MPKTVFRSVYLFAAVLATPPAYPVGGNGSVIFTCEPVYSWTGGDTYRINITARYEPGEDIGRAGLVWLTLVPPTMTAPLVYTLDGSWQEYQGGLFVPAGRYDAGLPRLFTATTAVSDQYVGWTVYAGHGVLTDKARQTIAWRRQVLDAQRAQRIAAGTWHREYESDERVTWSLVQKDADDNKKFTALGIIPSCNPWGNYYPGS